MIVINYDIYYFIEMGDTVVVYVAGHEIGRGCTTSNGHVTHNQQTYLSVKDFYTDVIQHALTMKFENCQMNKIQYNFIPFNK